MSSRQKRRRRRVRTRTCIATTCLLFAGGLAAPARQSDRNPWDDVYKRRTADQMAAQFEQDGRPVFRYRALILDLLQLEAGQSAAEIGAGSGFLSRMMARQVGPDGRVMATEIEPKMVDYMRERAREERLPNLGVVLGEERATNLPEAGFDVIAVVNTFGFFEYPAEMAASIAAALKPGGRLVVVGILNAPGAPPQVETDEREVVQSLTGAGLEPGTRMTRIPGHYARSFSKPSRASADEFSGVSAPAQAPVSPPSPSGRGRPSLPGGS